MAGDGSDTSNTQRKDRGHASEGGAIFHRTWGILSGGRRSDDRYARGPRHLFLRNAARSPPSGSSDTGDLQGGAIYSSACGVTLSIDAICSARNVLLSAGKKAQADMVRKCLGWSNAAQNTKLPAGMVATGEGTEVEWLLTEESAVELPAL